MANLFASKRIAERMIGQRAALWPGVTEAELWTVAGDRVGFAAIPRTMPVIQKIMDGWSKSHPVSATYLALWARDMGFGFVTIGSEEELAFESGFSGPRAAYLWRGRMKRLFDLGFIDRRPGAKGEWTHVLIWNPYHVISSKRAEYPIQERTWIALTSRVREIGATDLDDAAQNRPPAE